MTVRVGDGEGVRVGRGVRVGFGVGVRVGLAVFVEAALVGVGVAGGAAGSGPGGLAAR